MKHKKRGRVTQLLSKHGRLLVLEVSRPILTQNSRELLSLVPCEYVNRSISICYGNSFAKCANQTSSRVIFSLSPQQGNSEIPRFPPELSDIAGIPKGFPLSIILHIGMHMHTVKSPNPSEPCSGRRMLLPTPPPPTPPPGTIPLREAQSHVVSAYCTNTEQSHHHT